MTVNSAPYISVEADCINNYIFCITVRSNDIFLVMFAEKSITELYPISFDETLWSGQFWFGVH